jgi:hypothetical protein
MVLSTRSRLSGPILLTASIVLASTAFVLALIPARGSFGIPSYPYFSSLTGGLVIETMIIVSAALLALAVPEFTRTWPLVILTAGIGAVVLAGTLFFITFVHSIPIQSPNGGTVYVQPYPQTVLVFVWGVTTLLFLPVVYFIQKQRRSARSRPS